jgi:hypothetical protein
MKNQYRFIRAPKTLVRQGVRLDNFSLVPGNLLPFMSEYRALSDRQPKGTAVLVLPSPTSRLRCVYAVIIHVLREKGKNVKLYAAR